MPELAGRVADAFAARIRELEERALSPLAVRSYETRGRARAEEECRVRTPFQRDRDRILHSKPFRRLKGKTQVFIDPAGDHYRTRMTHTLETTGIARVVARALRLNEDLTEAIGLGHDMGHPPFGHAGEAALDRAASPGGFRHNEQSARIARRLNLTHEVVDGILTHTGDREPATLEGKIVRIVDRVAYINHDIDDAIRYGILDEADLPRDELEMLGADRRDADRHARPRPVESSARGRRHRPERRGRRARCSRCARSCSSACTSDPTTRPEHERAHTAIRRDLRAPRDARRRAPRTIVEFIAGMTDRFALSYAEQPADGADQGHLGRGRQGRGRLRRGRLRRGRSCARPAARYTGRCPFHEERTPSFSVNAVDKLYYCFGCGAKGDLITFVRETEGLDFAGAIEWLAERFRVPLEYEESSPAQDEARRRRERLFALLDQAATFYERTLWDSRRAGWRATT